jgi:hypothetical protein
MNTGAQLRADPSIVDVSHEERIELVGLYAIVRPQSYVVLLCNSDGVAIHHRGDASKDQEFNRFDQDAMLATVENLIQSGHVLVKRRA